MTLKSYSKLWSLTQPPPALTQIQYFQFWRKLVERFVTNGHFRFFYTGRRDQVRRTDNILSTTSCPTRSFIRTRNLWSSANMIWSEILGRMVSEWPLAVTSWQLCWPAVMDDQKFKYVLKDTRVFKNVARRKFCIWTINHNCGIRFFNSDFANFNFQ